MSVDLDPARPQSDDDVDVRLEGTVSSVRHFPDSRFTILRVYETGSAELSTWVGKSAGVEEGASVSAAGVWKVHHTYGRQFHFLRLVIKQPTTPEGIRRRLEKYPGLGPDRAEAIVARFGADALEILDRQPRRLLEVKGVGEKTLERVLAHHETRHGPLAEVENLLVELDLPSYRAEAIFKRFGEDAVNVVREHPYRLPREVKGIGFLTADRIARALGVSLESEERIDAGILYALERAQSDGHCGLPLDRLVHTTARLLELPGPRIREGVERLIAAGDLLGERAPEGAILCFPIEFVVAEQAVARALATLAIARRDPWSVGELPEHLSDGQRRAIAAIAGAGLVVLTGGPGTGKSTVTRQIIELALAHDSDVYLAAPTGRAAKRLAEATGLQATTIHRLLEIQGDSGAFVHHANNPLAPGLVVIDEASMLDLPLADALFSALTAAHRLMLVGDVDQLPSVGPGNVLRDVIQAASRPDSPIPVVRLDQIFRQAEGSSIVINAHRILHGEALVPDAAPAGGQFFVVHARDAERAHEVVLKVATERAPKAYGLDPRGDVQILCPMHKGRAGTHAFNSALQELHTAGAQELALPGVGGAPARVFRIGDRVMQIRNDHDRGVFNGDIGVVSAIVDDGERLVVDVDGVPVEYDHKQLAALQLAYAISIHKSQGSEFPAVVIPILAEHHVMLRRNLLYTAVTRARRLCVIVGDPRAIAQAIRRGDAALRFTGLRDRLAAALAEGLGEPDLVAIDAT
ncbi:MAG: ATP-dependent RecD-like DNA helicase [Myxococcales bacterium]|nr:ATP-dependent RecD-like DNA helicase [Myxococcales bacterium]